MIYICCECDYIPQFDFIAFDIEGKYRSWEASCPQLNQCIKCEKYLCYSCDTPWGRHNCDDSDSSSDGSSSSS